MRRLFRKKVGLALGGGGARGICHIGVLKVLDEENIPVDIIAGTSIGALIGGAYASGIPPVELEKKFEEFVNSKEFQSSTIRAMEEAFSDEEKTVTKRIQRFLKNHYFLLQMMFRPGILSTATIQSMINYFIPDIAIEECRIPFRAIATDLITGNEIVFSDGSLREAITASSAVPGAIEPVSYRGKLLSDGGIVSIVPVNAVKHAGADVIIAVVVDRPSILEEEPKTAKDVFYRACEITSAKLERYELAQADVVIRPDVMNLHWTNFSRAATLVREGEKITRQYISLLHEKKAPIPSLWKVVKVFTSTKK